MLTQNGHASHRNSRKECYTRAHVTNLGCGGTGMSLILEMRQLSEEADWERWSFIVQYEVACSDKLAKTYFRMGG